MKYTKTKYPNIFWYETLKGKRYYIRRCYFFQGKKKEVTKSGLKTVSEARAALTEIEKQIHENSLGVNTNITVADYWEIFHEKRVATKRWTPNTEETYKSLIRSNILKEYGSVKLRNLNRNDYEIYLANMLLTKPKESVKAINNCFMTLLNDAVLNGNIPANRLKGVYIGESAIPPKNKKVTMEQFQIWFAKAEQMMDKVFFSLTYLTLFGLRRGEIFGIRHMDILLHSDGRAILKLRDSRSNHTQNGRHGLKTKESERYVMLDVKGTELLLFLRDNATAIKKRLSIIKDKERDYISIKENGTLINPNRLNDQFEKINKVVGFRVTPHMMRHFFTTQSIIAGVPIEALSKALGHTKIYMTDKYNHVHDELSAQVTDTFSAFLDNKISHLNSPTNVSVQ
ncbi:tyrosine-type recombinase/integrase [Streptococcus halichoeri]|uniref:tyrosine-type recombinase/integrase n=1 Tax=Streptococcus halichoeri TaxID=254785 RepID=UPI001C8E5049|nr:tyrosine-type recombinase/integrase [Streptococcus halichoeri]